MARCVIYAAAFVCFLPTLPLGAVSSPTSELQYCSFFSNRAPRPQPNLKNCTWFKSNSCCMQEEIKATFDRVKPLPGADVHCQRYLNYLMCYICAPNQNLFYIGERLSVCVKFCNSFYSACRSAILKGSVIGDLYKNGSEFCISRSFKVKEGSSGNCFSYDEEERSAGTRAAAGLLLLAAFLVGSTFPVVPTVLTW